MENESIVAIF